MRLLGLITARGGSKRVPHKNLRVVGGKPLIGWTVEEACKSRLLTDVIVSTDSKEITSVAEEFGAKVPFLRPVELAGDSSSHIDCVLHALDFLEKEKWAPYEAIVLLQPTSPLRLAVDIDSLIEKAVSEDAQAMVSVCESVEHPYFARYIDDKGGLKPFLPQNISYPRKQDLPKSYFINGAVYYNSVRSLRSERTFYPESLKGCEMPMERALQVDTEYELNLADLLLNYRKKTEQGG